MESLRLFLAEAKKEFVKLILYLIIGGFITAVVAINGSTAPEPLPSSAVGLASKIWYYLNHVASITKHGAASLSVIFFLCTVIWVLFRLLQRMSRELKKIDKSQNMDMQKYKALVEEIGLLSRWPDAKKFDAPPWTEMIKAVRRPDNKLLCVLCANGEDTFGKGGAPLHECLSKFSGQARVILADGKSDATKLRVEAIGGNLDAYKVAINASIGFLDTLQKRGLNVDYRQHHGIYNWKLIITSHCAWVQYYTPGGPDVCDTPVYLFENNEKVAKLYDWLILEFERIWLRCPHK